MGASTSLHVIGVENVGSNPTVVAILKGTYNMRYTHWFWNSSFVDFVAHTSTRFNSWLWNRQYN